MGALDCAVIGEVPGQDDDGVDAKQETPRRERSAKDG